MLAKQTIKHHILIKFLIFEYNLHTSGVPECFFHSLMISNVLFDVDKLPGEQDGVPHRQTRPGCHRRPVGTW